MSTPKETPTEQKTKESKQYESYKSSEETKDSTCEVIQDEGSPINYIHDRTRNVWFATIGKYRVSKDFDSLELCKNWNSVIRWQHLSAMMIYGLLNNYQFINNEKDKN